MSKENATEGISDLQKAKMLALVVDAYFKSVTVEKGMIELQLSDLSYDKAHLGQSYKDEEQRAIISKKLFRLMDAGVLPDDANGARSYYHTTAGTVALPSTVHGSYGDRTEYTHCDTTCTKRFIHFSMIKEDNPRDVMYDKEDNRLYIRAACLNTEVLRDVCAKIMLRRKLSGYDYELIGPERCLCILFGEAASNFAVALDQAIHLGTVSPAQILDEKFVQTFTEKARAARDAVRETSAQCRIFPILGEERARKLLKSITTFEI